MRRRSWNVRIVLMAVLLGLGPAGAEPPTAHEIMSRAHARTEGAHSTRELHMLLVDARGNKRQRVLRSLSREVGEDSQSLLFFLSPADVRGTGFLSHDFAEAARDADQWLYLPALRRVKRIAATDKSASFMGSDLTFADLTRRDLGAFDYRLLGTSEVRGTAVWQIEATPRSEREIETTGYTRSLLFVRTDNYFVVRSVHWLRDPGRRKYVDVQALEEIDGVWVATRMHIATREGEQTLHQTLLSTSQVDFRQPLDDEHFTLKALARGPLAAPGATSTPAPLAQRDPKTEPTPDPEA